MIWIGRLGVRMLSSRLEKIKDVLHKLLLLSDAEFNEIINIIGVGDESPDELTSEQVSAITHAWLDCLATADIDDPNIDLGSLAEAARDSAEELEQAFPFLLQKV